MRLWPKSLAGQLTATLVLALFVAQTVAIVLFANERTRAVRTAYRENVVVRAASLVRLLEDTPPSLHERILDAATSQLVRFTLSTEPVLPEDAGDLRTQRLARDMAIAVGIRPERLRVALTREVFDPGEPFGPRHRDMPMMHGMEEDDDGPLLRRPPMPRGQQTLRQVRWIAFSIAMPGGQWLNGVTGPPPLPPPFGLSFVVSLLLSATAASLAGLVVARRITRPMRELTLAADRLGRGERVEPLPERGPEEVVRGTRAFNEMHARLDRFIRDRTQMLAAISHDLRTPITSLRLRAELVEDKEAQAKLIETLDEMQRMVEATLAFIRAEGSGEETREVDLTALVESLADDLGELDHKVTVATAERMVVRCRPDGVRRALRNVIENAVAYGGAAQIRLEAGPDQARIVVEDGGPGLPEEDLERVFEPFVRGEASRSRETGGIGLGLAIARTILRGHGGNVTLENRAEGGLRAILALPMRAASAGSN
ncbi:MAG: ATP-binding protein [Hyphomicrobiales bacterium]|nr:ATP-binding protein [Hyphomicrobiales bacterium]